MIKHKFGVTDGSQLSLFDKEIGVRYIEINSALVSAQNRQRFYVHNCGNVEQPKDRGIMLKDILESGEDLTSRDKSFNLTTRCSASATPDDTSKKHRHTMIAEPVNVTDEGKSQTLKAQYYKNSVSNFCCYTSTYGATGVAEPVCVAMRGRNPDDLSDRTAGVPLEQIYEARTDGKTGTLTTLEKDNRVAEPVKVGDIGKSWQGNRIYDINGKSITQSAKSGGLGSNTGLYAIPTMPIQEATAKGVTEIEPGDCVDLQQIASKTRRGRNMRDKCNCLQKTNEFYQYIGTKEQPIYEVKDGYITIKDKEYPIKLVDGYYIIRKLTVTECARLQTMPDDYCRAVSDSQGYKGLGNGWTAEVIIHILSGALADIPRDEEIVVLSMYDGIGTGRYCLDKMGFTNIKYYAYEIDKYAIQIAKSNYPDIIEMGDAFAVRDDDWHLL